MTSHTGNYIPQTTAESDEDQTVRLKQTSFSQLAPTMYSSQSHGTAPSTNYNLSDLTGTPTTVEGGRDSRPNNGNGKRPVYGLQYPRGYYNK